MTTAKQIIANRQNATRSTGPRTGAGKARSACNSLKHGLTAEQVIMVGEEPAAFEALRDGLYAHYQPDDPVTEHLVGQLAACMWRLKRVPAIEAGIYTFNYLRRETQLAKDKVSAQTDYSIFGPREPRILDVDAHTAAKKDQERAEDRLRGDKPIMGEVFGASEHSLTSLNRIAQVIEGSMYRAIRELERIKAERPEPVADESVIEVEVVGKNLET